MDEQVKATVRQILSEYLEVNRLRKTPERYAILDASYSIKGHFTLEELYAYLVQNSFPVSRATLYNAMKLFTELRLVTKHHLGDHSKYEAAYTNKNHCHQVCTLCGSVSELRVPEIAQIVGRLHLKRFRKDTYAIYFYGVCSKCHAKLTRKKGHQTKSKKI